MESKTNAMRMLDKANIPYELLDYSNYAFTDSLDIARYLNIDPKIEYKTLVTVGKSKKYYVFVLASCYELDLKKAAKAVNEKNIEMIPFKSLLEITGYIHGGCSPIGMKKIFTTTFHKEALELGTIVLSAGKIGFSLKLKVKDLERLLTISYQDIIKD